MRRFLHRWVLVPLMRWLTHVAIHHPDRLPTDGPAIVFANHNSHADTALLMAAFPTEAIDRVRPLAAADYWFRNRFTAWLSRSIVGAVAVDRSGGTAEPLADAQAALAAGEILIVFPEGTRGEPGQLGSFHCGIVRLAEANPSVPVIPVWLSGCDRVLPPHRRIPRRVRCAIRVGEPVEIDDIDPRHAARRLRRHLEEMA